VNSGPNSILICALFLSAIAITIAIVRGLRKGQIWITVILSLVLSPLIGLVYAIFRPVAKETDDEGKATKVLHFFRGFKEITPEQIAEAKKRWKSG
jgi:hypothetical protein